jgi:hypothetical protein
MDGPTISVELDVPEIIANTPSGEAPTVRMGQAVFVKKDVRVQGARYVVGVDPDRLHEYKFVGFVTAQPKNGIQRGVAAQIGLGFCGMPRVLPISGTPVYGDRIMLRRKRAHAPGVNKLHADYGEIPDPRYEYVVDPKPRGLAPSIAAADGALPAAHGALESLNRYFATKGMADGRFMDQNTLRHDLETNNDLKAALNGLRLAFDRADSESDGLFVGIYRGTFDKRSGYVTQMPWK